MALQLSTTLDHVGATFPTAYLKIDSVIVTTAKVETNLAIYTDQAARDADKTPLMMVPFEYSFADLDASTDNPIKFCYDKIKLESGYEGAVDV
jgi:hypothetical protein